MNGNHDKNREQQLHDFWQTWTPPLPSTPFSHTTNEHDCLTLIQRCLHEHFPHSGEPHFLMDMLLGSLLPQTHQEIPLVSPAHPHLVQNHAIRVLLVEDNASSRLMLEKLLRTQTGHDIHTATDGREGLELARKIRPQVVITDWLMPEMDGLELCQKLRATPWGQDIYVLMLTGVEAEEDLIKAYEAGVDEYVTKPVNFRTLQARLRAAWRYVQLREQWERDHAQLNRFAAKLAVANRKLEHAALTDPLTGLFNRRAAMDFLAQAWSATTRTRTPLALLAIDIDHFKDINDQHGHEAGDHALREITRTLRTATRKEDHLCRMGGEEFLVIRQNADIYTTLASAERLRQMVQALEIGVGTCTVRTSISIGIATREADMQHADVLVNAADQALYAAKHHGRNRICFMKAGEVRSEEGIDLEPVPTRPS